MYEELEDTRKALCERCRKFVSVKDIKYLPKGENTRMALCTSCLNSFNQQADKKKIAAKALNMSRSASYFCGRCRYKFTFNLQGNATLRCPYCGKSDKVTQNKNLDADSLLKISDD